MTATLIVVALLLLALLLLLLLLLTTPSSSRLTDVQLDVMVARVIADIEEQKKQLAEQRRPSAEQQVQQVLDGDAKLARIMLKQAGLGHSSIARTRRSQEEIRRIAEALPPQALDTLASASKTPVQIESLNLKSEIKTKPANFLTGDVRFEPITDLEQLPRLTPEHLMADDDVFYPALAMGSAQVWQPYQKQVHRRRLYILLDVSGSMETGKMRDGCSRIAWAAGLALNLLLRAEKGEAEFLLRYFDKYTRALVEVKSPKDARLLIDELLHIKAGGGGTEIQKAVLRGIADLSGNPKRKAGDTTDILIITDGESPMSEATIRRQLEENGIRLHAALIGQDNQLLKRLSATYQVYF